MTPHAVPSAARAGDGGHASSSCSPCRYSSSPAGRSRAGCSRPSCGSAASSSPLLLARLPLGDGNLAAAGMRGIGTSFRALAVGIPLVAVTVANESVGIAAALALRARVHARVRGLAARLLRHGGTNVRRLLTVATACSSCCPRSRSQRTARPADEDKFNPAYEWTLHPVDPDPPRPARPLDQQGGRLPAPRRGRVLRDRDRLHAGQDRQGSRSQAGGRRDDLRDRAGPGRRAGPADQGDRPLVPVRRAR